MNKKNTGPMMANSSAVFDRVSATKRRNGFRQSRGMAVADTLNRVIRNRKHGYTQSDLDIVLLRSIYQALQQAGKASLTTG
jgi:hypothetical protein